MTRFIGSPVGGFLAGEQQDLTAALYSDADVFYAPRVNISRVYPALWTDTDAFYAPTVSRTIKPALWTDTDTFYAPRVSQSRIYPALWTDTDTFYAPRVSRTRIYPALWTDTDTVYAPSVARGARVLTPALYSDADAFYSPNVSRTIKPALWTDTDAFYAPAIRRTIYPALYTDADTFYAPVIARGAVAILPGLYTDADQLYGPTLSQNVSLHPDADIVDGGWTNELDSNVNLYASIDELVTANDADYIKSESEPVADVVTLGLNDPILGLATPVFVRYRYKKLANIDGAMDLTARLMQGATEIAEWVHTDITGTFVDASQELTAPQFAAITDPGDLRVEFEANFTP